jgi:hypothetical protein
MNIGAERTPFRTKLLYHDEARLEYGRLLWKNPVMRQRLLTHWTDPRHPYNERFAECQADIEWLLRTSPSENDQIDVSLRAKGSSLRVLVREIPPVFGDFF